MKYIPAANRHAVHTRKVSCTGYRRDDGLWDIEGTITDTKSYVHDTREKLVEAGEALHDMMLRLTLTDDFVIVDAFATTRASPFRSCKEISARYAELKGLRLLGDDFTQKVRSMFRGSAGCTHITDLITPVATTAFQTIAGWRYTQAPELNRPFTKLTIDTCHSFKRDGETVKAYFPEFAPD